MGISSDSKVALNQLIVRKDRKHYFVEDISTGDYYQMSEVSIVAIELINQGKPLGEIQEKLVCDFPNEEINVLKFVNQLIEFNLVYEINGEEISMPARNLNNSSFTWVPESLSAFIFKTINMNLYVALLAASLLLMLLKPDLFPDYTDLFVFELMVGNVIAWLLVTSLLVLLHEFGHVLAVRSEGLPAKIEIGHRLFLVVLETDMSQVWKLPAERRNKLYLAGMYFDFVVLFLALMAQIFTREDSLITGLLKLVVLDTFIRLVYQTAVFMKTDLYYVLENKTGCYNLMENGRNFLSKWLPFLSVPETETFDGEEKFIRRYAYFYLAGILLTFVLTAYYYIPQMFFAVNEIMLPGFYEPITSIRFWDSVVFLLQIVLVLGLLLYSWSKKYRFSS